MIEFIDQTLRDGPQSLHEDWLPFSMHSQLANLQDSVPFRYVEGAGGGGRFATLVNRGQDPWTQLRELVAATPHQVHRSGDRPGHLGFMRVSDELLEFFMRTLCRAGIRSSWIFDVFYRLDRLKRLSQALRDEGGEPVLSLMWTLNPYYTDDYFASIAAEYDAWGCGEYVYIEDTAGVMTPDRARSLVTAVRAATSLPIELHFHNTVGLAELSYIAGVDAGATALDTACRPLANGGSLPSTERMLKIMHHLGYDTRLGPGEVETYSNRAQDLLEVHDLPMGAPSEFDITVYDHQIPGGMMQSLKRQLKEVGLGLGRLDEVLEEVAKVRVEFGCPVMATPISQYVGTQAVLNVLSGERYSTIPDDVVTYFLGLLGLPLGPLDEHVRDRVLADDNRVRRINAESSVIESRTVADLRHEFGEALSDEELCTRLFASRPHTVRPRTGSSDASGRELQAVRKVVTALIGLGLDRVDIAGPGIEVHLAREGINSDQ